jgi:hypothetical protein
LHHDNARLNVTTSKFETSNLRFCHIHLTLQTSNHVTFMPSVSLEASRGRSFGSDEDVEEAMC